MIFHLRTPLLPNSASGNLHSLGLGGIGGGGGGGGGGGAPWRSCTASGAIGITAGFSWLTLCLGIGIGWILSSLFNSSSSSKSSINGKKWLTSIVCKMEGKYSKMF